MDFMYNVSTFAAMIQSHLHLGWTVPFSDNWAERLMNFLIKFDHQDFRSKCAVSRQMTREQMDPLTKGRVWTGRRALEHGLIDAHGDIETAIEMAVKDLKISRFWGIQLVWDSAKVIASTFFARGSSVLDKSAKLLQSSLDQVSKEAVFLCSSLWSYK